MDAKFISDNKKIKKQQMTVLHLKVDVWSFGIGDSNSCHKNFPIRKDLVCKIQQSDYLLYMKKKEKSKAISQRYSSPVFLLCQSSL